MNLFPYILVAIQFLCIIFLAFTGRIIPQNPVLLILSLMGALTGIWAVIEMKFRFNIFPQLLKDSKLITSGPYRFIRHPMYTSVLIITLMWVIDDFAILRLIVWLILLIDLLAKLNYEEKILEERFGDYIEYKSKTRKLVPFVF
jgi:protein-S-isoprenylcysteine O-methyltransferase Ste14